MTVDFIPKRPHKKSRGGCLTCKTRKVKCDEVQPTCQFCEKRHLPCVYPTNTKVTRANTQSPREDSSSLSTDSPASDLTFEDVTSSWELIASPTPTITTSSGGLSIQDLKMFHQWATCTAPNVAFGSPARDAMMIAVPKLAFEHDFLLNAVMGIASLQVEKQSPGSEIVRKNTELYRVKAVSGYRQAVANLKTGSKSFEAVLIMAILLVILYSKDEIEDGDLVIFKWLIFYRGLNAIMLMESEENLKSFGVAPIFQRGVKELIVPATVPRILVELFQEIHPLDPDFPMLEPWCKVLDALGMLYASLQQDGVSFPLYIRIVAWLSYTNQQFTDAALERRPRILIVLTYYLAFLKLCENLWWIKGMPEREINAIAKLVGPRWLKYMEVPMLVAAAHDDQEIARLLLSS